SVVMTPRPDYTAALRCSSRVAPSVLLLPLLSSPTRRSSDLCQSLRRRRSCTALDPFIPPMRKIWRTWAGTRSWFARAIQLRVPRSEEHTSELQSRENLVCRLLLEKKKNTALPATTTYAQLSA